MANHPEKNDRAIGLRAAVRSLQAQRGWSQDQLATHAGVGRRTLGGFLAGRKSRADTLNALEDFVANGGRGSGFTNKMMYLAIASGMGAETNNEEFMTTFEGEWRVLRAHVPSRDPLISRLSIFSDDNIVLQYKHFHVVADNTVLLESAHAAVNDEKIAAIEQTKVETDSDDGSETVYQGFVFNCQRRAFLISTAYNTASMKEMVFRLPASGITPDALIRGLLLTVSADDREPFAARIIITRLPTRYSEKDPGRWKLGLSDWETFNDLKAVFNSETNYGLLRLYDYR